MPESLTLTTPDGVTLDAETAAAHIASSLPETPLVVVGWSFGGDVALSVRDAAISAWLAIAPPLRFVADPDGLARDSRPKLVAIAEHDEVCDNDRVTQQAQSWSNTEVEIVPGASHFFVGRTDRLVELTRTYVDGIAGPRSA